MDLLRAGSGGKAAASEGCSYERSRGWVFTLNNYGPEELTAFQAALANCKTAVIGREVGESGTPHLQGFAYWASLKSFEQVRRLLPGAHIEPQRGTNLQAYDYCCKADSAPWAAGVRPVGGKRAARSDLVMAREILQITGRCRDVAEVTTSYQALKGAELMVKYIEPKRCWPMDIRWYWGPTGSGKTRRAVEEAGPDVWISNHSLQWWDGYDAHENVIIDDFRGDFCKFHELLRILDRYEYRVMVKGGSRQLLARTIWITSCSPPTEAYPGCTERVEQLLRRITTVVHINCDQPVI